MLEAYEAYGDSKKNRFRNQTEKWLQNPVWSQSNSTDLYNVGVTWLSFLGATVDETGLFNVCLSDQDRKCWAGARMAWVAYLLLNLASEITWHLD